MRLRPFALGAAALLLLTAFTACSDGGNTTPTPTAVQTPDPKTRPSSPATLQITSPAASSTVTGSSIHVVVALQNATVVKTTSSNITPTEGHVHLYLDNQLIYMQYSLEQDVPVKPGVYTLKAEFVAADHFVFNPRVFSSEILFTVK